MFSIDKCFFMDNIKGRLKKFNPIWHMLQRIAMWTIWIEKNDLVFNKHYWFVH